MKPHLIQAIHMEWSEGPQSDMQSDTREHRRRDLSQAASISGVK